jgi:hypothetical protein
MVQYYSGLTDVIVIPYVLEDEVVLDNPGLDDEIEIDGAQEEIVIDS